LGKPSQEKMALGMISLSNLAHYFIKLPTGGKKSQAKFPKEKWNWDYMFLEDLDFTYMGKNPKKLQSLKILKSCTTNECGISFF
jgi:hypothetical protein